MNSKKIIRVEDHFRFLMKMFEILGFQYFNKSQLSGENANKNPSKIRFSYFFIRCVIGLGLYINYFWKFATKNYSTYVNIIVALAQSLNLLLNFSIAFDNLFKSYFWTGKLKKIYLKINQCIKIIQNELGAEFDIVKMKILINLSVIAFAVLQLFLYIVQVKNYDFGFFTLALAFYGRFYIFVLFIQYLFFASFINGFLAKTIKFLNENKTQEGLFRAETGKFAPLRMFETEKIILLKSCRKIYKILDELKNLINETFGLSVFIGNCMFIIAITLAGYRIFISYIERKEFNEQLGELNKELISFNYQFCLSIENISILLQFACVLIIVMIYCNQTKLHVSFN